MTSTTKKPPKSAKTKTATKAPAKSSAKKKPATPKKKTVSPVQKMLDFAVQKLDSGKADQITVLDLKGKSTLADYMVIATGTSSRHVLALAHNLSEDLKKQGIKPYGDGTSGEGNWVVLDLGDIIVHIFNTETRARYSLEEIWGNNPTASP